jgi:glycosyltransferase involved in cell wall biosynthesis
MPGSSDEKTCMNVLFLATFPVEAACTRYRCSQFFAYLESRGIKCALEPFLSQKLFHELYRPGRLAQKAAGTTAAVFGRLRDVLRSGRYDLIFVQREAALVGPPLFEWLFARVLGRRLVFDFDDAVFVPYTSPTYGRWATWLKCSWKTSAIIRMSRHVIAGNSYLAEYARRYNQNVSIIPTVVDLDLYPWAPRGPAEIPTIGWIGSPTTTQYLRPLIPLLERLGNTERFHLKIIGASESFRLETVPTINAAWHMETEATDFQSLDIGLYPLPEDSWSVGKCGFKAIQYMAAGAVCIASPVGVNRQIVKDGQSGLLAATPDEWFRKLSLLLRDRDMRSRLAIEARKTVEEAYSLQVHAPSMYGILSSVAGESRN